jgi:cytochrome o ubiquinol oxidase subunit I
MIWHIWWMAILGVGGAVLTLLSFGWSERTEVEVSGLQLADAERAQLRLMDSA